MNRKTTGVLCVSLAVAALGLLNVKYQVKELKRDLDFSREQLNKEREKIHILKAEWAYLNRPEQLSISASEHLTGFRPVQPNQVASFRSLESTFSSDSPPP